MSVKCNFSNLPILLTRIILIVGITVWSLVSFAGSYMTTFSSLLALRCLGGNNLVREILTVISIIFRRLFKGLAKRLIQPLARQ